MLIYSNHLFFLFFLYFYFSGRAKERKRKGDGEEIYRNDGRLSEEDKKREKKNAAEGKFERGLIKRAPHAFERLKIFKHLNRKTVCNVRRRSPLTF